MLSPYSYIDGNGEEVNKIMLRTIKSLGYLEEAYEWNDEGNFDRVSAMDMVMILRADRLKLTNSRKDAVEYVEEDEFISSNFDSLFTAEKMPSSIFKNNM